MHSTAGRCSAGPGRSPASSRSWPCWCSSSRSCSTSASTTTRCSSSRGLIACSWFTARRPAARLARCCPAPPGLPAAASLGVVPIVAIAVPLVDVLMALPGAAGHAGVQRRPRLDRAAAACRCLCVQLLLMAGSRGSAPAASVYLRDVPENVSACATLLFYMHAGLLRIEQRARALPVGVRPQPADDPDRELPRRADRDARPGAPERSRARDGRRRAGRRRPGWLFRRLEPGFVDEL